MPASDAGHCRGVENVSHLMREISAASQEQSVGIEQINQTVVQMDQATQQNAALVEEATAAARELQSQAGTLTEAVSVFRQQEPHEVRGPPDPGLQFHPGQDGARRAPFLPAFA
jgi:methyl-accepting chemotaxis protein